MVIMLVSIVSISIIGNVSAIVSATGLSGYTETIEDVQQIIDTMDSQGMTVYRMSFNPEWYENKTNPYDITLVNYFLDNCEYNLIIDRNHLYPPTPEESGAVDWGLAEYSLLETLSQFPNNPRVIVELINEYVLDDFQERMQTLVDAIRSCGYTNGIVVNKWETWWANSILNDPLDNIYYGMHFYFNSWSVESAVYQMQLALSNGLKIINTEIGADFNEYTEFEASEVQEVNEFMHICHDLGITNLLWMSKSFDNWITYIELNIQIPTLKNMTLVIKDVLKGTTNPTPGTYVFDKGETVIINAEPDYKYSLLCWKVNGNYVFQNQLSLCMEQDYEVYPIFYKVRR